MTKAGKGGPDRLLTLKGLTWWAKLEIPKDCRSALGGKTAIPENMETGDIRQARARRDVFERDTKAIFTAIRAGNYDPQGKVVRATERGVIWREALTQMREDPDLSARDLETAEHAEEAERETLRGTEKVIYERAVKGVSSFDHHAQAYLKSIKLAEKTTRELAGLLKMVSSWFTERGFTLDRIGRREVGSYCSQVLEDLHPVTGRKRLGAAKGYWDWLVNKGHVAKLDGNPWVGQLPTSKKRSEPRRVCRRLQLLSRMEHHEQDNEQVFP